MPPVVYFAASIAFTLPAAVAVARSSGRHWLWGVLAGLFSLPGVMVLCLACSRWPLRPSAGDGDWADLA